jgi:hypothetical protein
MDDLKRRLMRLEEMGAATPDGEGSIRRHDGHALNAGDVCSWWSATIMAGADEQRPLPPCPACGGRPRLVIVLDK